MLSLSNLTSTLPPSVDVSMCFPGLYYKGDFIGQRTCLYLRYTIWLADGSVAAWKVKYLACSVNVRLGLSFHWKLAVLEDIPFARLLLNLWGLIYKTLRKTLPKTLPMPKPQNLHTHKNIQIYKTVRTVVIPTCFEVCACAPAQVLKRSVNSP